MKKELTFKSYTIRPNGFGRYDLFKTSKKKPTGEEYLSNDNLAYAVTFYGALLHLLALCTDEQEKDTLGGYMDAYKENLSKVQELINKM